MVYFHGNPTAIVLNVCVLLPLDITTAAALSGLPV